MNVNQGLLDDNYHSSDSEVGTRFVITTIIEDVGKCPYSWRYKVSRL